jgi:hypothetical protein
MAAGSTYTPIATYSTTGSQASYTFTSIPSTYTDLVLVTSLSTSLDQTESVNMTFNGDSASNYSATDLIGTGSSAISGRYSTTFIRILGRYTGTANTFSNMSIAHIQNYANSTTFKTVIARGSNAGTGVSATAGLWRATPAAITSATILTSGGSNYAIGSTFTLYGIKAF